MPQPSRASCLINITAKMTDKEFPKMGMRLFGNSGTYTFTQYAFTCMGTEKGATATVEFDLRSVGKFANTVCGTGKLISNWGSTTLVPGSFSKVGGDPAKGETFYRNLIATLKYGIEFQGATGEFYWHNDGPGLKPESTIKPATIPKLTPDPTNNGKFFNDPKIYIYAGQLHMDFTPLGGGKIPPPPLTNKQDPSQINKFDCGKAVNMTGAITLDV
jgi:hypothetical protein